MRKLEERDTTQKGEGAGRGICQWRGEQKGTSDFISIAVQRSCTRCSHGC